MPTQTNKLPVVAIVGRPNVGKSAVFNRLAGRRIAIVHDQPGVTRDRITADCSKGKHPFSLVDTGGIGGSTDAEFGAHVETEAEIAIATADLVVFTVDGKDGITPVDESVARLLRRATVPVLLVVNKIDHEGQDAMEGDFASLGFPDPVSVSAAHGRNFPELVARLDHELQDIGVTGAGADKSEAPEEVTRIAIVGRPNVGKSSLINAILKDKRTIVSDIPGTTRDAVDVPYQRDDRDYLLIDTAGLRPKGKRDSSVEVFSAMRSEKSVRRADLCLLVIDSARGVTSQDRKIARLILTERKPCIVVLNKFDLFHPEGRFHDRVGLLLEQVQRELFFLHYAQFVAVSALKEQYTGRIFAAVEELREAVAAAPNTGTLNRILQRAIEKTPPPATKGKRLNLLYASPLKTARTDGIYAPAYLLFVNHPGLLTPTYQRYLESELRRQHHYEGLPIAFDIRSRRTTGRREASKK